MKQVKIYILTQKYKPILSVGGKYIAFNNIREAKYHISQWKKLGDIRVYGHDIFSIKDIKIVKII